MLQDDSRELSKALASKPGAYLLADERAELVRLREEVRQHRAAVHSCHPGCTIAGCVAERNRKDAERYRWIRDPKNGKAVEIIQSRGIYEGAELDAAIDAAMQEQP